MNPYRSAIAAGSGLYLLQLAIVAYPQLVDLGDKSGALVVKAIMGGTSSVPVGLTIVYYLLLGLGSHVLPMLLAAKIYLDGLQSGPPRLQRFLRQRGTFSLSLLALFAAMVVANAHYFPRSSAFPNRPIEAALQASPWIVWVFPALFALVLIYWLVLLAGRKTRALAGLGVLLIAAAWTMPFGGGVYTAPDTRTRPDVIVIGVDSLRPDHLASYGFPGPSLTPTIDMFVSGAVHYPRSYTPLARTFIAYMSILTGRYPVHHGARENLYPTHLVNKDASVAHYLSDHGYQTVFAMDEARFANFDEGYGFDIVASPPPGILDFGIGTFLDTLGTNLLQLAPYSDVFLPHLAGNRAAGGIYRPDVHNQHLARVIRMREPSKPLFLVSHFCIAHVPFAPADHSLPMRTAPFADSRASYQTALRIADSQVAALLDVLRAAGRLENAVVVLLSDHGEGLGMGKDRWIRADGRASQSYYGHGTPALEMSQSNVLFAIQRYRGGNPTLAAGPRQASTSLVDVLPTILGLGGIPLPEGLDGIDLLSDENMRAAAGDRPIFIESGMSGTSLQRADVDPNEVANQFSHLYRISDASRFELAPEALSGILAAKQRAVVIGNEGISAIPPGQMGSEACWLRLKLSTNQVECFPQSSDDATIAEGRSLICDHFSGDTTFHTEWCAPMGSGKPLPGKH